MLLYILVMVCIPQRDVAKYVYFVCRCDDRHMVWQESGVCLRHQHVRRSRSTWPGTCMQLLG